MWATPTPTWCACPMCSTARVVPWAAEPVAVVIHDCQEWDGSPVQISPRGVLRRVLKLFDERGWTPVVAPEMEFYLVARQQNPHEPLQPPLGRTGKPEAGGRVIRSMRSTTSTPSSWSCRAFASSTTWAWRR